MDDLAVFRHVDDVVSLACEVARPGLIEAVLRLHELLALPFEVGFALAVVVAVNRRPRHAEAFHAVDHIIEQPVGKQGGYVIAREHHKVWLFLCDKLFRQFQRFFVVTRQHVELRIGDLQNFKILARLLFDCANPFLPAVCIIGRPGVRHRFPVARHQDDPRSHCQHNDDGYNDNHSFFSFRHCIKPSFPVYHAKISSLYLNAFGAI